MLFTDVIIRETFIGWQEASTPYFNNFVEERVK